MYMKLDLTMTYIQLHQTFLTIKQIGHKYYSKILNIYIPTLAKRIMS